VAINGRVRKCRTTHPGAVAQTPAAASDMESRRDPAVRIRGVGLHMTAAQRGSAPAWIMLG
jgi:hypothetical protein